MRPRGEAVASADPLIAVAALTAQAAGLESVDAAVAPPQQPTLALRQPTGPRRAF